MAQMNQPNLSGAHHQDGPPPLNGGSGQLTALTNNQQNFTRPVSARQSAPLINQGLAPSQEQTASFYLSQVLINVTNITDNFHLEEIVDFVINRMNKQNIRNSENYSPAGWHYKHQPCPFYKGHSQTQAPRPPVVVEQQEDDLDDGNTPQDLDQAIDQENEEEEEEKLEMLPTRPLVGRPQGYTKSNQNRGGKVAPQQRPTNSIKVDPHGPQIEVVQRPAPNVTGPVTYSTKVAERVQKRSKQGIVVPTLKFENEVVDLPLDQSNAGFFPPKNFLKIPKVVGNKEFVVVKQIPFANHNHTNISGLIYQDKTYGRFYTAGGQCIKTDKYGYVITYIGKGSRPYPVLWKIRDVKSPTKKNDNKPTQRVVDAFAHRDTLLKKYNLKSVKNIAWKSGSKDPKQLTIDCKTNSPYKPGTYTEYDEFLKELRQIVKEERGVRIKIRKNALAQAKSASPNRRKDAVVTRVVLKSSSSNNAPTQSLIQGLNKPSISRRRKLRFNENVNNIDNSVVEPNQTHADFKVNVGGISYALTKEEYEANKNLDKLSWKSSSKKKFGPSIPHSSEAIQEEKGQSSKEDDADDGEPWLHHVQHSEISQGRIHGVAFDDFGLMTQHHYVKASHPKNQDKQ